MDFPRPAAAFQVSGEGREKVLSDDRGRDAAGESGAEVSADGFGWKSRGGSVGWKILKENICT